MAGQLNGIILVDKEAGFTSHDAVAKLRRITGMRRIGHAGTLDPMATGLLVVFIGRATRAAEFAEAGEKHYLASLRLGLVTDTLDTTGTVISQREQHVSRDELEAALLRFTGEMQQIPPMYSAVKIGGRKLYEIARAGGEVQRAPRRVFISSLRCLGRDGGDWILDVVCSRGTYIRSLCADIGEALGCGGCMSALRRESSGAFSVEDAHTLDEIERTGAAACILPTDTLFAELPALSVGPEAERRIRTGSEVRCEGADGDYRVYGDSGFLALSRLSGGKLRTIKSFFEV